MLAQVPNLLRSSPIHRAQVLVEEAGQGIMSDRTKIEWARGDDGSPGATWNPVNGCTGIGSPGCDHCYAKTFAERFRGTPDHYFEGGFDQLRPEKLVQPLRWRRPRRIFVNSMSDLPRPSARRRSCRCKSIDSWRVRTEGNSSVKEVEKHSDYPLCKGFDNWIAGPKQGQTPESAI